MATRLFHTAEMSKVILFSIIVIKFVLLLLLFIFVRSAQLLLNVECGRESKKIVL